MDGTLVHSKNMKRKAFGLSATDAGELFKMGNKFVEIRHWWLL